MPRVLDLLEDIFIISFVYHSSANIVELNFLLNLPISYQLGTCILDNLVFNRLGNECFFICEAYFTKLRMAFPFLPLCMGMLSCLEIALI